MTGVIFHVLAWPTFGVAILVFGFAPGAALRVIVLFYRTDDPRRRELLGELYAVPRIERPFWVAEQLEVALFEGLRGRLAARRAIISSFVALFKAFGNGYRRDRSRIDRERITKDLYAELVANGLSQKRGDGILIVMKPDGTYRNITSL